MMALVVGLKLMTHLPCSNQVILSSEADLEYYATNVEKLPLYDFDGNGTADVEADMNADGKVDLVMILPSICFRVRCLSINLTQLRLRW